MFEMKIQTSNGAFYDGNEGRDEIARILRDLADKIEDGYGSGAIYDTNDNRVGSYHHSAD